MNFTLEEDSEQCHIKKKNCMSTLTRVQSIEGQFFVEGIHLKILDYILF